MFFSRKFSSPVRIVYALLCVLSRLNRFFVLFLCSLAANQVLSAPRIVCDAPKYDFGTLIGSEKITHEFVLWNRGE